MFRRQPSPLPGYGLTIGYTMLSLSLVILLPLGALLLKTYSVGWSEFWRHVSTPRAMAAYRLTFGASLIAAGVNVVFGLLLAWVLVRYDFPGKRLADAFDGVGVDLGRIVFELAGTGEFAYRVLIVIEDYDIHSPRLCLVSGEFAWPPWPIRVQPDDPVRRTRLRSGRT